MAGSGPLFQQLYGTAFYEYDTTPQDAGWVGFYYTQGGQLAQSISLWNSFGNGVYVFADSAPRFANANDVNVFLTNLTNAFSFFSISNVSGCAWLPDVTRPDFGIPAGQAFSFGFQLTSLPSGYYPNSDYNHILGQRLTLVVGSATYFCVNSQTDTWLTLKATRSGSMNLLTTPEGNGPLLSERATIPFTGAYRGCFSAKATLQPNVTLPFFTAGMRYAHGTANGGDVVQHYPLFVAASASIDCTCCIDIVDTFNSGPLAKPGAGVLRTLFALAPGASPAPKLASYLRTTTHRAVSLAPVGAVDALELPQPHAGALVLEPTGPNSNDLYLAPAGDFAPWIDGASEARLVCGIFGSEFFTVRGADQTSNGTVLRFLCGEPAYAPVFPYETATLQNAGANAPKPPLTDDYRTSWVAPQNTASTKVSYASQPEGSSLYAPPTNKAAALPAQSAIALLDAYSPAIPVPQDAQFAVPLVAYAGLPQSGLNGFDPKDLSPFESQIIAKARKSALSEHNIPRLRAAKIVFSAGAALADARTTTTPQGLLVDLAGEAGDDHYRKVVLAQTPASDVSSGEMALINCDAEMQDALQTNQLFLVAVNREHFGPLPPPSPGAHAFSDSITIAGWTFRADVGRGSSATDFRNVVIMKFCEGTVMDRLEKPDTWSASTDFSIVSPDVPKDIALTGLSQWCREYCQAAIAEADAQNPFYVEFGRIVREPAWKGILVLRVDLSVNALPEELRALAAGIDQSQFYAHHFGINVTPVKFENGVVQLAGLSSVFGLVDYQYPAFRNNVASGGDPDQPIVVPASGDYGFTVLQLQALFSNSLIVDYQSRIQLTVNSLFGSQVTANYSAAGSFPANAVVLRGSYQQQGAASIYAFEEHEPVTFVTHSNVLQAVSISRMQFHSLAAPNKADATLRSRFTLWGALDFVELEGQDGDTQVPFDVFSFGSPVGTDPKDLGAGLAFSGVLIELSSPAATPNSVTYEFIATEMAFDVAASTARDGSLFKTLALQPRNFISAASGKRAADLGFLNVRTPDIRVQAPSDAWFGIAYSVTMGTPGALVANAGFESTLLVGWSPSGAPGDDTPTIAVGLQLPGAAPGAKLFSIQGVLKLSIDAIELRRDEVQGSTKRAFVLRLNNVGLSIFGVVKLPPGATINFFLFGDPDGTGSLGWYAAYIENQKQKLVRV